MPRPASRQLPDLHFAVGLLAKGAGGGGQAPAVRTERYRQDLSPMAGEPEQFPACRRVPDLDGIVVALVVAASQVAAVGAEHDATSQAPVKAGQGLKEPAVAGVPDLYVQGAGPARSPVGAGREEEAA